MLNFGVKEYLILFGACVGVGGNFKWNWSFIVNIKEDNTVDLDE